MRIFIALSLVALVAAPLSAQDMSPPPPADTNPHGGRSAFGGNQRGPLFIAPSGKPFRAAQGEPYPIGAWFAQADTNHDGKLTMAEMRDDATRFFRELDTNHDGEIDPDEVRIYETVIAPEIQTGGDFGGGMGGFSGSHPHGQGGGRGGHRGGGGGAGPSGGNGGDGSGTRSPRGAEMQRGAGHYSLIDTPEPVTAADTDLDRSVTLKEFQAKAVSDFQDLDIAQRGYLTLDDLPKPMAEVHPNAVKKGHKGPRR